MVLQPMPRNESGLPKRLSWLRRQVAEHQADTFSTFLGKAKKEAEAAVLLDPGHSAMAVAEELRMQIIAAEESRNQMRTIPVGKKRFWHGLALRLYYWSVGDRFKVEG